jgi:hypothetical protein
MEVSRSSTATKPEGDPRGPCPAQSTRPLVACAPTPRAYVATRFCRRRVAITSAPPSRVSARATGYQSASPVSKSPFRPGCGNRNRRGQRVSRSRHCCEEKPRPESTKSGWASMIAFAPVSVKHWNATPRTQHRPGGREPVVLAAVLTGGGCRSASSVPERVGCRRGSRRRRERVREHLQALARVNDRAASRRST